MPKHKTTSAKEADAAQKAEEGAPQAAEGLAEKSPEGEGSGGRPKQRTKKAYPPASEAVDSIQGTGEETQPAIAALKAAVAEQSLQVQQLARQAESLRAALDRLDTDHNAMREWSWQIVSSLSQLEQRLEGLEKSRDGRRRFWQWGKE